MRLDVRAIGEAVAREGVLRPLDVRLDDVEIDDNRGCIQLCDQSRHHVVNSPVWARANLASPRAFPMLPFANMLA